MRFDSRELKVLRVRLGLKQEEVAKKVGWSLTNYNLKENGKRPFSLEDVYKVAQAMGMTNNDIAKIFFAS